MASRTWEGKAPSIQQIATIVVGGTISGETFTISAKHPSGAVSSAVVIASVTDSTTVAATNAAALAAAWNASNHVFATKVTASVNSATITLTSDVGGVPFVVTVNTPGGSATFVLTTTTANSGPNDYSVASNWREGAVPIANDEVVITGSSPILYGLDQSAIRIDSFEVTGYTGQLGDFGTALHVDPVFMTYDSSGLGFLKIGNGSNTSIQIFATSQRQPFGLYLHAALSDVCEIHGGSVSICPFESDTATITTVKVNAGIVDIGDGLSYTSYRQTGGNGTLRGSGGVVTLIEFSAGELQVGELIADGIANVTTMNILGGLAYIVNGATFVTMNAYGGFVNFTKTTGTNTVTTLNQRPGARVKYDTTYTTVTTHNKTGPVEYVCAA